ncbi:unnamed protein product [Ophioblennius macclurei]
MSWMVYVDRLVGENCIAESAIIGIEKNDVWAASPGFQGLTEQECRSLVHDKEALNYFICGKKFLRLTKTDEAIQLKAKDPNSNGDKPNICVTRSAKCVIIASSAQGFTGGPLSSEVCKVREYLVTQGY